jgi:hypothetical protein
LPVHSTTWQHRTPAKQVNINRKLNLIDTLFNLDSYILNRIALIYFTLKLIKSSKIKVYYRAIFIIGKHLTPDHLILIC